LTGQARRGQHLEGVERAFRRLPDRYLGAEPGFDAIYHVRLGDVGHTWEVRCTTHGARVRKGVSSRQPDVTIGTDSQTWARLRAGELSGIEAFSQRKLYARGNLDLAIAFEGLFRLPNGRPPLLRVHDVHVGRTRVSTLTMGRGHTPVLLLHGLGGTKHSFFDTLAALSPDYRVHAMDLPGFGSSSKPATAGYDAPYFARSVLGAMDELGIERAHVVGNSMGGRVAIEMGLTAPDRVRSLGLLCAAVAWIKRGFHPIVRLLRPEFGLLPHRFGRDTVARQFLGLFSDRDQIDPSVADVVVDEFQRIYGSAGARIAFLAAARNVSRPAVRPQRLLSPAGAAHAAQPVHLVLERPARAGRLPAPRRALAARGPADRARRMRARTAGRAPGADQRAPTALLRRRRCAGRVGNRRRGGLGVTWI